MTDVTEQTEFKVSDSQSYVKIRYRVRIAGGPMLKGAVEPEIMDFVTGYGQVIPGLERRLIGHSSGDTLAFTVPPDEAFGVRHEELVIEKSKKDFHFPAGLEPYQGMELPLVTSAGEAPDTAIIREVKEDTIVIDCNHPLSGKPLEYSLEIVEVRPAQQTDVCSEWEEKSLDSVCAGLPHEIVIGGSDDGDLETN